MKDKKVCRECNGSGEIFYGICDYDGVDCDVRECPSCRKSRDLRIAEAVRDKIKAICQMVSESYLPQNKTASLQAVNRGADDLDLQKIIREVVEKGAGDE